MIKDGGLSFETQLKIEFLPPNNVSKKCLLNPLIVNMLLICLFRTDIVSPEEVLDEKPPLDPDKEGKSDSVSEGTGCSSADTKIKKHVTFSEDTIDNEKTIDVKLITPLQFFVVCVISIIISVVATAVWCHLTDAPYCPSYDYLYIHGRYWYYYFFKTPDAVNSSFF